MVYIPLRSNSVAMHLLCLNLRWSRACHAIWTTEVKTCYNLPPSHPNDSHGTRRAAGSVDGGTAAAAAAAAGVALVLHILF